jgi:integrase
MIADVEQESDSACRSDGRRRSGVPVFLRHEDWPEADRLALHHATAPVGPFDPPGRASHWRPETLRMRRHVYARYLGWLRREGLLRADEGPADRITEPRLTAYLQWRSGTASAVTMDMIVRNLRSIMQAIAPERDWCWITRHPLAPRPAEIKAARRQTVLFSPTELLEKCLDLMDRLDAEQPSRDNAALYRDALITALLCLIPVRGRNLAEIEIGTHLIVEGDVMRLVFDETKTAALVTAAIPEFFCAYVRCFLDRHRELLLAGRKSTALWVTRRHGALGYATLNDTFERIGTLLLGHPVTAHGFRHSVATAIMTADPRNGAIAAGALAHKGLASMTRYYDHSADAGARNEWARIAQLARTGKL